MSVQDRRAHDVADGHPVPGEDPAEAPIDELPAALSVRIRFTPSLPLVRLTGELDLASLHLLTDALDAVAAASCPGELVVLDLSGITFCDVAGLRTIEMCAATLAAVDKQLLLYQAPASVKRLIEITGVARYVVHR